MHPTPPYQLPAWLTVVLQNCWSSHLNSLYSDLEYHNHSHPAGTSEIQQLICTECLGPPAGSCRRRHCSHCSQSAMSSVDVVRASLPHIPTLYSTDRVNAVHVLSINICTVALPYTMHTRKPGNAYASGPLGPSKLSPQTESSGRRIFDAATLDNTTHHT